jgi:hypothetical protein
METPKKEPSKVAPKAVESLPKKPAKDDAAVKGGAIRRGHDDLDDLEVER